MAQTADIKVSMVVATLDELRQMIRQELRAELADAAAEEAVKGLVAHVLPEDELRMRVGLPPIGGDGA